MRTLGLDWGRDCLAPDFWLGVWRHKVQDLLARDKRVVVDDMRFPNELQSVTAHLVVNLGIFSAPVWWHQAPIYQRVK